MLNISSRANRVSSFQVMRIVAQAQLMQAKGQDVIQLAVGELDEVTPAIISEAGREALAQQHTRYTSAIGMPALRQALAHYYQSHKIAVQAEHIAVTSGASAALQLALLLACDVGEHVMVMAPGYPCNTAIAELLGLHVVVCETEAEYGFQPQLADVQASWQSNIKAVLLASPANPTGTVLAKDALQAIATWVEQQGAWLIVDEIYHGMLHDNDTTQPSSALAMPECTIGSGRLLVLNSFSKTFAMTGWRLGWLVAPAEVMPPIERMAQNLFLAPSTPAQHAALQAFQPEVLQTVARRRMQLKGRIAYVATALQELGFVVPTQPQGAFYVFADAQHVTDDAQAWCETLLAHTGVALTPGGDFGRCYHTWIRLAVTADLNQLRVAMARIRAFLNT